MSNLEKEVEIYKEKETGIPHVFAPTMKEAMYAEGYLHA